MNTRQKEILWKTAIAECKSFQLIEDMIDQNPASYEHLYQIIGELRQLSPSRQKISSLIKKIEFHYPDNYKIWQIKQILEGI